MDTPALDTPRRPRLGLWHLSARGAAWVLLGCCVVIVGTILFAGERETYESELRAAISGRDVSAIRVEGNLRHGTVHWRDGVVQRVTELEGGQPLRVPADVVVTYDEGTENYSQIGQWRVPGLTIALWLCVSIGAIALLIVGPQPWRATRWAWFWLLWPAPPLGAAAFLLLGGSTWQRPPARPDARLTGGWAFLISVFGVGLVQVVLTVAAAYVL